MIATILAYCLSASHRIQSGCTVVLSGGSHWHVLGCISKLIHILVTVNELYKSTKNCNNSVEMIERLEGL